MWTGKKPPIDPTPEPTPLMKAKRTPTLLGLLSLAISLLATSSSLAQMNYQGRLTDSTGENLPNGQYTIAFSMYDEAGLLKWGPYTTDGTANQGSGPRVEVVDGRFNTVIGNLDPTGRKLSEGFDGLEKRYLQIKVGNNPAITPRQLLLPAPIALYAPLAGHALTATSVGNGSGSSPLTVDFNSGNVGIGTSNPTEEARCEWRRFGSFIVRPNGTYGNGSIFSDSNYGMLFRSAEPNPSVLPSRLQIPTT